MIAGFSEVLETLARHRGVKGSLVVSETDGLLVDANLRIGQRGDRLAALAASVYRKARRAAEAARLGSATFLQLDAEHGHICAAGRGDLLIVVIAEPAANIGLLRVELLKAVDTLA